MPDNVSALQLVLTGDPGAVRDRAAVADRQPVGGRCSRR